MELKSNINIQEIINYSDIGINNDNEIKFENFSHKDWQIYWSSEKMFSSKNLDIISPVLKVQRLPEMVFGYNRFVLINEKKDFIFEINPFDMLDLSSFKEREKYFTEKDIKNISTEKNVLDEKIEKSLNNDNYKKIYYIPKELKVQYTEKWKSLKVDRDDIQKSEPMADWSYSSPYLGTISNLSSHKILLNKSENQSTNKDISIEFTEEDIPLHR